jgi:hypothetical protein
MQLTEAAKALPARVRRIQQGWRWRRWFELAASSVFALASIVAWLLMLPKLLAPETFALIFTSIVGEIIARWENPTCDLLLRLTDTENEKKPDPPEDAEDEWRRSQAITWLFSNLGTAVTATPNPP